MRSTAIATAIGFAMAGCSPEPYELKEAGYAHGRVAAVPSDATKIRFRGSDYYRLTGPALRQTIVGKSMFYDTSGPGSVMVSGDGRYFNSDGCGYARNRDLVGPAFGNYWVKNNRVCTKVEAAERPSCFALFRSDEGLLLEHGLSGLSVPRRVVLEQNTGFDGFHSCPLIEPI